MRQRHWRVILCCGLLALACGPRDAALDIGASRIGLRTVVCSLLGNNVAAVATRNGLVIVDSHRSPATMAAIMRRIERETGRRDVLLVVNTHGDWDHCSGNQLFPDSLRCGHGNAVSFVRNFPADAPQVLWPLRRKVARWRAGGPGDGDGRPMPAWAAVLSSLERDYRPSPPARTFTDTLVVDGGDAAIELAWAGDAHTDNDVLVYVPQERLLFTGDLFTSAGSFGFQVDPLADVPRLLRVLDGFLARGVDHAVPGHGPVLTGTEVRSLRELLAERYAKYDGKRSAAKWLEEAMATEDSEHALRRFAALSSAYYRSQDELSILGRRLQGQGRTAEAAAVFRAGLREHPGSALMCHHLAGLHLAQDRRDSASHYYRLVLQAVPGNRDAETMVRTLGDQ